VDDDDDGDNNDNDDFLPRNCYKDSVVILTWMSAKHIMLMHVCLHNIWLCSGSSWGWSIVDDSVEPLPYICEIPKTLIYKIVRVTRGYGEYCLCCVI